MKAIVLSGGGSKGSYQIGVWKALRKLHIKYDIVTGTSVGALNGALMVQNKFHKAIKLWSKINMELLFGDEATNSTKIKDVLNMYRINFFKNGGMDVKILEEVIDKYIDKDTFYNSKIDFGLVAVNLSGKKAVQMKKKDIPKDKLTDYLINEKKTTVISSKESLEDIQRINWSYKVLNGEKKEVRKECFSFQVKETDIIIVLNGIYKKDNKEKNDRIKMIKAKMESLRKKE